MIFVRTCCTLLFHIALAQAANGPWTGTWSVSPTSGNTSFSGQTFRQIVHTSIGGSAARIQLSNAFGDRPVQISDVHIAMVTSGSSIHMNTLRAVTFDNTGSTTIAVGSVAVSDSIPFPVPALSDVAVSFYIPETTGPATWHQQGTQTNYISVGNVSGQAEIASANTTESYYFLVNLDVQNSAALGSVVAFGASITDGFSSTLDMDNRWPNLLASRLMIAGLPIGVLNQGINGNELLANAGGQSALTRFSRDVLSQPGVRWVIFSDDPINDLGSSNPPTSDQLIAGLTQLISQAHQNNLTFLCSTLTPFQGADYWTPLGETGREAVNAFIRSSSSGCDGVIDQDAATHDPANQTTYLPAYDSGDHLHPSPAGLQAIANAVNLDFLAMSSASSASPSASAVSGSQVSTSSVSTSSVLTSQVSASSISMPAGPTSTSKTSGVFAVHSYRRRNRRAFG